MRLKNIVCKTDDGYHFVQTQTSLHWRHNDHDDVSKLQPHGCLLNRLFQTQIKENIKAPRHWPLYGEFTGPGEFPAQRASNTENVSIWWRHHVLNTYRVIHGWSRHQHDLTHWCRGKMDAISQTTFWSAFSWMKMFEFRLKFHWSLFLRVQLTIFRHWFR